MTETALPESSPKAMTITPKSRFGRTARAVIALSGSAVLSASASSADTVLDAKTLDLLSITHLSEALPLIPGAVTATSNPLLGTQFNVRGLTTGSSPSVVLDGIPLSNVNALSRAYKDLASLEIVKQPAGRNSAGAFLLATRRPGDAISARLKAQVADDNSYEASGSVDGPMAENVSFGLHADYRTSDGYYRNSFLKSKTVDDVQEYGFGARALFTPHAGTAFDLAARTGYLKEGDSAVNGVFALPVFAQFLKEPLFNESLNTHQFVFQNNIRPVHRERTSEVSLKWDEALSWANLTAWALYSNVVSNFSADNLAAVLGTFSAAPYCRSSTASIGVTLPEPQSLGATPEGSFFGPFTPTGCDGTHYQVRNQHGVSAALALASPQSARLRWRAGIEAGYFRLHTGSNLGIDTGAGVTRTLYVTGTVNPTEQLFDDRAKTETYAGFAEVGYNILPHLETSAGVRYDRERHRTRSIVPLNTFASYVNFSSGLPVPVLAALNPGLDPMVNGTGVMAPQHRAFDQVSPHVGVTWAPRKELSLYAGWDVGFKSGGFNALGTKAATDLFINNVLFTNVGIGDSFAKERTGTFQGGARLSLFADRFTLRAGGYYTRLRDLQFTEMLAGPFGMLRAVDTIDRARISGGEVEATAEIFPGVSIFGGANTLTSRIKAMTARPDAVGNRVPYAPTYTITGGARASHAVTSAIHAFGRIDVNSVGSTYFHVIQCQNRPTLLSAAGNYCGTRRDAFTTLNLRAGVRAERWSVVAFVQNLTDAHYIADGIVLPELGLTLARAAAMRRFGATLSYAF